LEPPLNASSPVGCAVLVLQLELKHFTAPSTTHPVRPRPQRDALGTVGADGVALAGNDRPLAGAGADDLQIGWRYDHRLVPHDQNSLVRPQAQYGIPRSAAQLAPPHIVQQAGPPSSRKFVETFQRHHLTSSSSRTTVLQPVLTHADLPARPPGVKPNGSDRPVAPARRWSVVPRPTSPARFPGVAEYAVCPNCRERVPLTERLALMECRRCKEISDVAWDETYFAEP